MKHQNQLSFITDDQAEHMGADMAIQFMLMMLFQIVPEMADDPRGFRSDVHRELTDLVATYKLPPMPEAILPANAFSPNSPWIHRTQPATRPAYLCWTRTT
jgi:hypothetical protein